jgi:hypothetical protein
MINADEPVGDLLRDIPTRPGRVTRLFEQWTTQVTGSLALALGSALIVDWRWLGGERGVSTLSAGFAAFIMGLIVFWPFARYAPEVIQRSALHSEIRGRNFAGEALGLAPVILLGAAAAALNLATAIAREGMPRGVGDWAGALLFLLVVTGGTAAICWGVAAISNETAADALEFWYGNGDRDEVAQVMVLGGWVLAIISGEQLLEYENNPTPILFKTHLIWLLGTAWMALSMVAGLHFSRLFRPLLNRR